MSEETISCPAVRPEIGIEWDHADCQTCGGAGYLRDVILVALSADDYRLLLFALGLAGGAASREGERELFRDLFELTGRIMRQREPKYRTRGSAR